MKFRRLAMGVAAAVLLAPASAQAALYLYADNDYKTQIGVFSKRMSAPRNMSAKANDRLSSFKNDTGYYVAFYHNANGGGRCFTGKPHSSAAWFAFWDDNKVSSFQLGRSCG